MRAIGETPVEGWPQRVAERAGGCLCRVRGRYDRVAAFYDRAMVVERLFFPRARRRAVELLNLLPDETVVDVACGSGKNLALLRAAVGESGRVVGVDWSPNMLAAAHERVLRAGWSNSPCCGPTRPRCPWTS